MAVITFRRPEEGLETYKSVLDMISLFQDIVKNPDVIKNVQKLSKEVSDSLELAEDKKQELANAQETIAQSNEFLEELEKMKLEHAKKVKADYADIDKIRAGLVSQLTNFSTDKELQNKSNDKAKSDAADTLAIAKKLTDETSLRLEAATKMEKTNLSTAKENELKAAKLSADWVAFNAETATKNAIYEASVKKLSEDREAFEARNKKLMESLKSSL